MEGAKRKNRLSRRQPATGFRQHKDYLSRRLGTVAVGDLLVGEVWMASG